MAELTVEQAVEAINEVLGERHGGSPVGAEDRFEDLGLDSLDVAEIFLYLEEQAGCRLDPESAGVLERVGDLVNLKAL